MTNYWGRCDISCLITQVGAPSPPLLAPPCPSCCLALASDFESSIDSQARWTFGDFRRTIVTESRTKSSESIECSELTLTKLCWICWSGQLGKDEMRRWFGEHPAMHGRAIRRHMRKGRQPIKSSEKHKCYFLMREHRNHINTDSYNPHSSLRKHTEVSTYTFGR